MNIVRFNLWDYFKYARILNLSLKRLCTNYFVKVTYKNEVYMLWEIDYVANFDAYIKKITKIGSMRSIPEESGVFSEFNIDESIRCKVQNEIFYEENRIPLKTKDIVYECNRKAFLEDLAFFELKDDTIIGYGQILLLKDKYTIANFGIIEEFRGKGYGEALLIHILNQAKIKGLKEVYIKVKSDNINAINLYKKTGFEEASEISIYELLG